MTSIANRLGRLERQTDRTTELRVGLEDIVDASFRTDLPPGIVAAMDASPLGRLILQTGDGGRGEARGEAGARCVGWID